MAIVKLKFPDSVPIDHIDIPFLQGMLDRMAVGFHNYGHVLREYDVPDSIACLKLRLRKYRTTHNIEYLMDAANFCMMEFMRPKDVKAFFEPTTKRESPGAICGGKHVVGKEDFVQPAKAQTKRGVRERRVREGD